MSGTPFSNVNNIHVHSMIPDKQGTLKVDNSHLVAVQYIKNHNTAFSILVLLPFVQFNTLTFVWDITLKLQQVSTRNPIGR